MKKILIHIFALAVAVMLFERCARIPGSISGGPKDETPPQFVHSAPPNYSTGFNARRVDITFDEYLQLRDVNNQFYSSPHMTKRPEILLYGKRVRVNLKEPLLPDFTYTFDFGTSITDLNEGNVNAGFTYVFSTGQHIDSLTFTGRVLNAFDLKPRSRDDRQAIWVLLHSDLSDSAVYNVPPTYVARADQTGFFTFSNIRPDTFRIFALRDMNANMRFDMPNERIAFSDTLTVIDQRHFYLPDSAFLTSRNATDSIKENFPEQIHVDVTLYLFEEAPVRQYRANYERKEANMLRFVYHLPVDSLGIEILEYEKPEKWYELEISASRDTFDYWLTDTALVNRRMLMVHLHSPRTDSLNVLIYTNDTLRMPYEEPRQPARSRRERRDEEDVKPRTPVETMTMTASIRNNATMDLTDRLQLVASQPIESIDRSKIILQEQDDTLKKPVAFTLTRDTLSIRRAWIDWNLKEDTKYFLTVDSASFISIYGVDNDSTGITFTTQREDFYSTLEITFDSVPCQLIVQALRGDREEIVKQVILSEGNVVTFDFLRPDKYRFKVIYDCNGNGKWDTGNYLQNIQPEKVEYFTEPEVTTHSNVKTELQWPLVRKRE